MAKQFKFGKKMQRKSWNSQEIDQEWEEKKIMLILVLFIVIMVVMGIFMWWMRKYLT